MSEINALKPTQPDGPFRVMARYKHNDEFEIFDEYTDRYTAEDVAKDLVTRGQAVEAEVIRVGGEHNRRRVVTYSLVKSLIKRKSGNNVIQTIGSGCQSQSNWLITTSLSGNEATSLSSPPSAETNRRSVLT